MSSWERWEAPKQIMALREEMERVSAPTTLHVNPLCPQEAYNLSRKTGHTRKPTLLIFPLVFATKDLNKWLLTRNDFLMDRVSHNMKFEDRNVFFSFFMFLYKRQMIPGRQQRVKVL